MLTIADKWVGNWKNALKGARNPMNSWDKSDSITTDDGILVSLGNNDKSLIQRLCVSGTDHRKVLRQILVSMTIDAPLYWWKEFDTYKVGTTANSCSTMHKINSKPIDKTMFSLDKVLPKYQHTIEHYLDACEAARTFYNDTKDKDEWYSLIQMLPSSFNQMRTVTLSYENLMNIYYSRKDHKLDEWHVLCDWIETLPCMDIIIKACKINRDGNLLKAVSKYKKNYKLLVTRGTEVLFDGDVGHISSLPEANVLEVDTIEIEAENYVILLKIEVK